MAKKKITKDEVEERKFLGSWATMILNEKGYKADGSTISKSKPKPKPKEKGK